MIIKMQNDTNILMGENLKWYHVYFHEVLIDGNLRWSYPWDPFY